MNSRAWKPLNLSKNWPSMLTYFQRKTSKWWINIKLRGCESTNNILQKSFLMLKKSISTMSTYKSGMKKSVSAFNLWALSIRNWCKILTTRKDSLSNTPNSRHKLKLIANFCSSLIINLKLIKNLKKGKPQH